MGIVAQPGAPVPTMSITSPFNGLSANCVGLLEQVQAAGAVLRALNPSAASPFVVSLIVKRPSNYSLPGPNSIGARGFDAYGGEYCQLKTLGTAAPISTPPPPVGAPMPSPTVPKPQ